MDSDDSDAPTGPSRAQKGKTRAIISSDSEPDDPPRPATSNQNQLPPGRAVQTNGPRVAFNAQSKAKGQAIISGLNDRSAAKNLEQTGSRGGTPAVDSDVGAGATGGGNGEAMQVDVQEEEEEEEEDFATGMAAKGGKKRKVGDVSVISSLSCPLLS